MTFAIIMYLMGTILAAATFIRTVIMEESDSIALFLGMLTLVLFAVGGTTHYEHNKEFNRRGLTTIHFNQKSYYVKHATAADVRELVANLESRLVKEDAENEF